MKKWIVVPQGVTIEAGISLRTEASKHVIARYYETNKNQLVAWVDDDWTGGCIKNNRSVVAQLADAQFITLIEVKPAKGAGRLSLEITYRDGVKGAVSLFSARHSLSSLTWLQQTQPILADLFSLAQRYVALGYDV